MLFAQRLQTGPVPLRQSGSVLDLVLAHVDVSTLQEVTRQSGASISAAFDGCGWIPGGGVKQKSDSGRGQACSKFQHDGRRRLAEFAIYFGHFKITDHYAIGNRTYTILISFYICKTQNAFV